ncbi:class I SAM-dependent methyltransferase [Niveispirillum sp.]|uniref:class I SAM-dependent methyltransferase n=1 Tax=Niveispirillum sp. TaxID=1917217 RepID=UPI001B58F67C|nr:class I SAM-dependent methyltransferase [Niveispirillum sp.]MBP7334720.1 class I SAM-dependent methyltransferase [Niveispirillum sp.]
MQFIWPDNSVAPVPGTCPVCAHVGPHQLALILPGAGPAGADWVIVECPDCGSRFSTDRNGADYRGEELPDTPFLHYYMEQGAGLRSMLEPLGFAQPGPRRMLEIGGGFGFPSDYVQTVLGWTAKCYDPSGLAVMGQRYLGLDITRDYWTTDTPLPEPFDVAYASEVIEHIPEPAPFLAAMRRAVGDTGIVVLTTPNGTALNPGTTPAMLIPIASPGLHLTLFSARGLEHALRAAGFAQVKVDADGAQLRAFASDCDLPAPQALDDAQYQAYLRLRIATPDIAAPLLSGLRYRLLKELVNAGRPQEALALFGELAQSMRERFGIDLERPADLVLPDPSVDGREWLSRLPGNLTGLLYFRAVLANNAQGNARAAALFAGMAALAGASLRRTLRPMGIEDGETEALAMAAVQLHLTAAAGIGADTAPLLTAVERGHADHGLLLPAPFRSHLRRMVAKDLRATRHSALLWRVLLVADPGGSDETDLLSRGLAAGLPPAPIAAFNAIESAANADSVRRALLEVWSTPGIGEAPASLEHARKLALIRLVLLGAFADAETLFDAWNSPRLADDPSVADALAIAAAARRNGTIAAPVPGFASIESAPDVTSVHQALWSVWTMPGAAEAPITIKHARKLALIRLVLLGAFAEAEALFEAWEDPGLADDAPVATALAIAASAR